MASSKSRTFLKSFREARGLSAAELAQSVAISRQTIYAIEDGTFIPNTSVALRLARALEVSVEDLFTLEQEPEPGPLNAELLTARSGVKGELVRLCRVNNRLIAVPVPVLPTYLPAADGILCGKSGRHASVQPALDLREHQKSFLLAGCDPALSVLAESLAGSGMEIISVPCSSRRALEWLKQGRVHAAGAHLLDAASGEYNIPFMKRMFPKNLRIVTFAVWEQGLVLARGNPKSIRTVADLAVNRATLINREKGSGSRDLLDKALRSAGIPAKAIMGYERLAGGHLAAAQAVRAGMADCCIAARSAARCFGLDFIPLTVERFDLCFSGASAELPAAKALLETLNRFSLRRKLQAIAGYDTAHTGEILA